MPAARRYRYDHRVRAAVLVVIAACGGVPSGDDFDLELAQTATPSRTSAYLLLWNGDRIGGAVEELVATPSGYQFIRTESITVMRSTTRVESRTRIRIDTDRRLRAHRVQVETRVGATVTTGEARRDHTGAWRCTLDDGFGGEPELVLPAEAEPSELAVIRVARADQASFSGPVFRAGFAFATAHLSIESIGNRKLRATATTDVGSQASTIELDRAGNVVRIETGAPLSAIRVARYRLRERFDPPEIVDSSAIPIAGSRGRHVVIARAASEPPAGVPGQSTRRCDGGWLVSIDAPVKPDRQTAAILRALSRRTATMLEDELDAPAASAGQALALGRGDCTAHSRVFAQIARSRGYEVALVTGFRNDGGARLVRHRWALVHSGAGWVHVDPTYGEALVSPGVLIALAMHGDSAREIGLVDEVVFAGLRDATARYVDAPPACD